MGGNSAGRTPSGEGTEPDHPAREASEREASAAHPQGCGRWKQNMYEHTMCSVNEQDVLLCQSNTSRVVGLARLAMTARNWPDAAMPDGGQMAIARSKGREAEAMGMSHLPLPPHSSRGLDALARRTVNRWVLFKQQPSSRPAAPRSRKGLCTFPVGTCDTRYAVLAPASVALCSGLKILLYGNNSFFLLARVYGVSTAREGH